MAWTSLGADAATMATGTSALIAAAVWLGGRRADWKDKRAYKKQRDWHGYIGQGIDSWYVKEVPQPDDVPLHRVVLEVVNKIGSPNPSPPMSPQSAARYLLGRDRGPYAASHLTGIAAADLGRAEREMEALVSALLTWAGEQVAATQSRAPAHPDST